MLYERDVPEIRNKTAENRGRLLIVSMISMIEATAILSILMIVVTLAGNDSDG